MLLAKSEASACIIDFKYVYVIGGFDGSKSLNDIQKYDIANDSWIFIESKAIEE